MGNKTCADRQAGGKKEMHLASTLVLPQFLHGHHRRIKLIMLGSSESGKSTLLKQMRFLHAKGFATEEERMKYSQNVRENLIMGLKKLMDAMEEMEFRYEMPENQQCALKLRQSMERWDSAQLIFAPECVAAIKSVWADPAIGKSLLPRYDESLSELVSELNGFVMKLDCIFSDDYVPTLEDILHLRIPTRGIVEVAFSVNLRFYRVFDVGGRRSERKKWVHCFENVHSILFVVAVSEFDQMLPEDGKTNRLVEAMHVFRSVCNAKWFMESSILLFFNKTDLFERKIQTKSIKSLFRNYEGSNAYQEQIAFLRAKFEEMVCDKTKPVYTHETCAIDTNLVKLIQRTVFQLISEKLEEWTEMY